MTDPHPVRFPRSAGYDPQWQVDGCMGPNAIWLLEWLMERLELRPGARVLDLGCGAALTSVFLAKEYGVRVVAADLWVQPGDNWTRIVEAGCADSILPVHAEAHDLKFAPGYFDAIVSIDAYQYFGTDALYVGYLSRYLADDGQLGVVMPAVTAELDEIPEHLTPYWEWEFAAFHTPAWWRRLWAYTGRVVVDVADDDPDGWRHWLDWCDRCETASSSDFIQRMSRVNGDMLRADEGRTFTFARLVARKAGDTP